MRYTWREKRLQRGAENVCWMHSSKLEWVIIGELQTTLAHLSTDLIDVKHNVHTLLRGEKVKVTLRIKPSYVIRWRMPSSGMLTPCGSCKNRRSVRRLLVRANVPSSPILVTLMMEALRSWESSHLTGGTRPNIPEDGIPHSHRHENLKSYNLIRWYNNNTNPVELSTTREATTCAAIR
jgi:hypothetical protein